MFGGNKPHLRISNHHSTDGNWKNTGSNPFYDSDDTQNISATKRTSSEPTQVTLVPRASLFDDDSTKIPTASYAFPSSARNRYRNDFRDNGGYENQSVQELESCAVYKSEETTRTVNNCLKIAEDIREDAANTLVQLHHQGEQINRTHMVATEIDHDLSRGEKLLGNLGSMFSRTWKPKKNRDITGPIMTRDDSVISRSNNLQQPEKLGLNEAPKRRSQSRTPPSESADAFQRVEFEKSKQDDGLSDLSDLLGDLKNMAIDMGNELERQNKALDPMEKDIDEVNDRVNQANRRARRLLGSLVSRAYVFRRFSLLAHLIWVVLDAIFLPQFHLHEIGTSIADRVASDRPREESETDENQKKMRTQKHEIRGNKSYKISTRLLIKFMSWVQALLSKNQKVKPAGILNDNLSVSINKNAGARLPDTILVNVLSDGHGDRKQVVAEANCIRNRMSLPRTRSTHAGHPPPPPPAEEHSRSATYGAETRLIPTGPNPLHN